MKQEKDKFQLKKEQWKYFLKKSKEFKRERKEKLKKREKALKELKKFLSFLFLSWVGIILILGSTKLIFTYRLLNDNLIALFSAFSFVEGMIFAYLGFKELEEEK